MTNRRMRNSDYLYDSEDDSIGLTSAFPAVKGPQSVEYDKGDDAIGLTGAFAPIVIEDDERSWDEEAKWKNFDWDSYKSESGDTPIEAETETGRAEASESAVAEPAKTSAEASQSKTSKGPKHGRHAAPEAEMSPRMQKAKQNRRVLVLLIILVILIIVAVGVYSGFIFKNSQQEAHQAEQEQIETPKEDIGDKLSDGAGAAPAKATEVPNLTSVLGMNSDAAIKEIGHGAVVTANRPVNEEGNPIKTNLNVALTDEPVDSKTGSPTVYLGLDQAGNVIQVGYSASASALGFGSLSFADAINDEHVVEKTLSAIGVDVPEGSAILPADKKEYTTYASDGTTVTRERCSFAGDADVNGVPCSWSAVLSYDYTTQVVTGDLSDTVRVIYVYLTKK